MFDAVAVARVVSPRATNVVLARDTTTEGGGSVTPHA
jgi:hypothetical protein